MKRREIIIKTNFTLYPSYTIYDIDMDTKEVTLVESGSFILKTYEEIKDFFSTNKIDRCRADALVFTKAVRDKFAKDEKYSSFFL